MNHVVQTLGLLGAALIETLALVRFAALEKRFTGPGPVFLVGCGHSGTSASLRVLAKAPSLLAMDDETRLFLFPRTGIFQEFSYLVSKRAFSKLSEASSQARAQGGVWVEKTPRHVLFVNRIRFWVPNSRFVAVWRDPLDVVPSLIARGAKPEAALKRWIRDNSRIVELTKTGTDIHIFRFEDLLTHPARTVQGINTFLAISGERAIPTPEIQEAPKKMPSRDNHAVRRNAQMGLGLFDSRGNSARDLPEERAAYIRQRTALIVAELEKLQEPTKSRA